MTIENVRSYPQFGEVIGNPLIDRGSVVRRTITAVVITGLAIGVAALIKPTLVAMGIGFAVAAGAIAIYALSIVIFRAIQKHKFDFSLKPQLNDPTAPKLGEYSKADLRVSNHVTESFEWKKQLIASAKSSIELSANFAGGESFREVLLLIESRMDKYSELKTHILVSDDLLEKLDKEELKRLDEKFAGRFNYLITGRVITSEPFYLTEENHLKTLIVDGQYCSDGGSGIHPRMVREQCIDQESDPNETFPAKLLAKSFRDTDVFGYGEIAKTKRNQFFNLYHIWERRMRGKAEHRYFEVKGEKGVCELFHQPEGLIKDCTISYIVSGPEHRKKNPITREIASLIKNAKTSFTVASFLFNPGKKLRNAFIKAKKKNENLKVVGYVNGTPKGCRIDHWAFTQQNRPNYDLLDTVHECQRKDVLYHKKVFVVDDEICLLGSSNVSRKSEDCDNEAMIKVISREFVQEINKGLEEDHAHSVTFEKERVIKRRLAGWLPGKVVEAVLGYICG